MIGTGAHLDDLIFSILNLVVPVKSPFLHEAAFKDAESALTTEPLHTVTEENPCLQHRLEFGSGKRRVSRPFSGSLPVELAQSGCLGLCFLDGQAMLGVFLGPG